MGLSRYFNTKSPMGKAAASILLGAGGAALGSYALPKLGLPDIGLDYSKIGGAIGGGIGAGIPQGDQFIPAAAMGGYAGYHMGPDIAKGVGNLVSGQGWKGAPAPTPTTGVGQQPSGMNLRGPTGAPTPTVPGQPGVATAMPGAPGAGEPWTQSPYAKMAGTTALQQLMAPSPPPEQPMYPTGPMATAGQAMMQGGGVPGFKFDAAGNITGVDPQSMPDFVKNAISKLEEDERLMEEQLRDEASRKGMLGSSAYLEQVNQLNRYALEAKREIYSRYAQQAYQAQVQRQVAGAGLYGQAGVQQGQYYANQQTQYNQQMQAIGDMVRSLFGAEQTGKEVKRSQ